MRVNLDAMFALDKGAQESVWYIESIHHPNWVVVVDIGCASG